MGVFQSKRRIVFFLMITIISSSLSMLSNCTRLGAEKRIATFVFGDSLVDVGNNNYIGTLLKANMTPNGIDFGRPTGRFTNGRNILDIIVQQFGSILGSSPPPYLAPSTKGSVILQGVNYASGGSGILNETARIERINLDAQLDNFANTKQDIISQIGEAATKELLEKALFAVSMGSNDFMLNYLLFPIIFKLDQPILSPEAFVNTLISRFRLQLTRLYTMGARKIAVVNVGPIGCTPFEREFNIIPGDDCYEFANQVAQLYNTKLKSLIKELSSSLKGSKFLCGDVYRIFNDIAKNYRSYGFENADRACCSLAGRFGGLIPCGPQSEVCCNRSKYVFWDPYHPSEAAYLQIAKRLIDGDINDISPINLRQLLNA